MKKIDMKPNLIKNWTIHRIRNSVIVCGDIYNDTKNRFINGTTIQTSKIVYLDMVNGAIKTLNSTYNLDMNQEE